VAFPDRAAGQRIQAALAEADRRTAARIVTVITDGAGDGTAAAAALAAVLVLIGSGLVLLSPLPVTANALYIGQVLAFIGLGLGLASPPLRRRLGLRARQRQARLEARAAFVDQGLAATAADRGGVLLFVAAADRCVEIIAAPDIAAEVAPDVWQRIVDGFAGEARAGRLADACVKAIEAVAWVLAQACPLPADAADAAGGRSRRRASRLVTTDDR
jgi:uncharacterized membrane protein